MKAFTQACLREIEEQRAEMNQATDQYYIVMEPGEDLDALIANLETDLDKQKRSQNRENRKAHRRTNYRT